MWTIGITKTGNELGMTKDEVDAVSPGMFSELLGKIESKLKAEGAHFVVESLEDCLPVIETINKTLETRCGR